MGTTIKFTFKIDEHRGVIAPAARIWIDSDRSETLEDDEELRVVRKNDAWEFTAEKRIDADSAKGMAFRVTYVASPGDEWSLVVSSTKPEDHNVYKACGILSYPRQTVVGRCAS